MRGAGLARSWGGEFTGSNAARARGGAVVDDTLHHFSDYVSDARIKHLAFLRLEVVDDIAVGIPHGTDHDRRNALAVVGEDGVSGSHVHGRGVIRSQSHGRRCPDG